MLESVLSAAAAQLYGALIDGADIVAEPGSQHDPAIEGTAANELQAKGLLRVAYGSRLLAPLEPMTGLEAAAAQFSTQIGESQRSLLNAIRDFEELQRKFRNHAVSQDTDNLAQLLTEVTQIVLLSAQLPHTARSEVLSFNTTKKLTDEPSAAVVAESTQRKHGVQSRAIYTTDYITERPHHLSESRAMGEEIRLIPDLPTKMTIVDRTVALVAIDETGLRAALLVRSLAYIDMLRMLFELVWERAVPYGEDADTPLTPHERRVLQMLATGARDDAIASDLGVTTKTVRRHITAAMDKIGTDSRFAAGVQATKRGWM